MRNLTASTTTFMIRPRKALSPEEADKIAAALIAVAEALMPGARVRLNQNQVSVFSGSTSNGADFEF